MPVNLSMGLMAINSLSPAFSESCGKWPQMRIEPSSEQVTKYRLRKTNYEQMTNTKITQATMVTWPLMKPRPSSEQMTTYTLREEKLYTQMTNK